MKYLLLIYHTEAQQSKLREQDANAMYQEYGHLIGELSQKGKYLGGYELKPTSSASTVRVRDGKKVITDGPFAETKEQLGGYFLVEAADLDEALAISARIPSARDGSVEVRPVIEQQMKQDAAKG
jgi:hypothetical protein